LGDYVYDREGEVFHPTKWAGSPWAEGLQHGGPINALFATAAQEAAAETGLRPVRLTVDLFQAVPRVPLELSRRFVRKGRRSALIEARLCEPGGDTPLSSARAVLLAPREGAPRGWEHTPAPPLALAGAEPVDFLPKGSGIEFPPGFHESFEVRMGKDEHGAAAWITTPLDFGEGVAMTPWQRCAAVADLTFGLSGTSLLRQQIVDADAWAVPMINVDTTLYWERPPVGEWFGFRHALLTDHEGIGLAEVDLADAEGRLGRSLQAMIANAPPKVRATPSAPS